MSCIDAHAVEMRESEWIKIGVDSSAGKTACPRSITCGKTIPGDSELADRTKTGELVKGGLPLHVEGCDAWRSNLAPVCNPLLSVGQHTTMGGVTVLYGDKSYMFHKGSNVAKKLDASILKESRDSPHRGVANEENNMYNIHVEPEGGEIDAMPLSEDSDNRFSEGSPAGSEPVKPENPDPEDPGGTGGAPDPEVPRGTVERTIQCEMMWMVTKQWCRGCMGHALCRSWFRHFVASKGRAHAHSLRDERS